MTNEAVPVLGTDSRIVTRGFDARARQNSKSPRTVMLEFQKHFDNERFSEALSTLESVLRDRPDDPALLYLIAVTHRAAGQSNLAVPTLERVIAIDPQHVNARKLLCILWTEEGRCTEAEAQMNPLIAAGTADAEAWALRGAARLRGGDLSNAAADAAQSLQIDPQLPNALLVRCAVLMRQGQLDAARDDLDSARKAGAPEAHCEALSQELDRKTAEQQRKPGAPATP